jgi:hypothetical protein
MDLLIAGLPKATADPMLAISLYSQFRMTLDYGFLYLLLQKPRLNPLTINFTVNGMVLLIAAHQSDSVLTSEGISAEHLSINEFKMICFACKSNRPDSGLLCYLLSDYFPPFIYPRPHI